VITRDKLMTCHYGLYQTDSYEVEKLEPEVMEQRWSQK
jgi:hypothetical protein